MNVVTKQLFHVELFVNYSCQDRHVTYDHTMELYVDTDSHMIGVAAQKALLICKIMQIPSPHVYKVTHIGQLDDADET